MEAGGDAAFFSGAPLACGGYDEMRILLWLLRFALFVVLLGFAVKNGNVVTLHFFFDTAWSLPLVVVMLIFFAAGALAGLMAALGAYLRQRRARIRLQRQCDSLSGAVLPQAGHTDKA
jgi:uncharacterized integral membrane protein